MMGYSRRRFLQHAASLAALYACGAHATQRKVVVVGAGLSGLYAAMLLERFGYAVTVVEGRDRVGGRMYTLDDVPGRPEAGGNVIGPGYGRIIDTAQRLQVPLHPPGRALPSGYIIDGQKLDARQWLASKLNPFPDQLKKLVPDRVSGVLLKDNPLMAASPVVSPSAWRSGKLQKHDVAAAGFFAKQGLNEQAVALLAANNSYGNTLQQTSLISLYRVMANLARSMTMGQPAYVAAKGNMRLPERMAASLRGEVVSGETIVSIEQRNGSLRATGTGGKNFDADAVILALPATAVRKLNFTPALSLEQKTAFEQIEYHKVTQAHLLATEPYWQASGDPAGYWTNGPLGRIFVVPSTAEGQFNMTVWINGNDCDRFDGLPEQQAGENIMQHFFKLFPAARGKVSLQRLVRWQNEPLNEGAWALWRPGDIGRYADLLHQPAGRVFFAGEHTAFANSGMEGAMESAERAVIELMRAVA